jgi:hypothetical protein
VIGAIPTKTQIKPAQIKHNFSNREIRTCQSNPVNGSEAVIKKKTIRINISLPKHYL